MDINKSIRFWCRELNLSRNQFIKPYIKHSKRSELDQKGFGYGTCGIMVYDTILKERILMAINVIADTYSKKIKEL